MYIGVDVGGTKTLLAILNGRGEIKEKVKFPTPKNYAHFMLELRHALAQLEEFYELKAGAIAIPGDIDRKHGRALKLGNLPWKNANVQNDMERLLRCPFVVENDAKLAALSEALLIKDKYNAVLYVTVSTGIGYAIVVDGKIDTNLGDAGGRDLMLEHKGKHVAWEDFAGGRAIVDRYGKMAKDITDETTWHKISRDLAQGLIQVIAVTQPDAIVFGGSVGNYFKRFHKPLNEELHKYKLPLTKLPVLRQAKHPDEAVVYGCYDAIKQTFPHHAAANQ